MTKAQWKEKYRQARTCRNHTNFQYYDEPDEIPKALEPYLVRPLRLPTYPLTPRQYLKGDPRSYVWIKERIKEQLYGYQY